MQITVLQSYELCNQGALVSLAVVWQCPCTVVNLQVVLCALHAVPAIKSAYSTASRTLMNKTTSQSCQVDNQWTFYACYINTQVVMGTILKVGDAHQAIMITHKLWEWPSKVSPVSTITIELVGMWCHTNHTNTHPIQSGYLWWMLMTCFYILTVEYSLQLVDGSSDGDHGYLEILDQGGAWRRICSDSWNQDNAMVACRQLGYQQLVNTSHGGHYAIVILLHINSAFSYLQRLQLSLLQVLLLLHPLIVLETSFIFKAAHHFNFSTTTCALQARMSC